MKTVGLPISLKENEKRRTLLPKDLIKIKNLKQIYIEKGYGEVLGLSDKDYTDLGVNVADRDKILQKDIICDPKIGDAEYLHRLNNQIIFGWVHAVQNRNITDEIIAQKLSAYAWEDMYEGGRHLYWKNNEIAGEAAVFHAYMCHGVFPNKTKVAVLGRGNIARGAIRVLNYLGAEVVVYDRKTEGLFRKELPNYDVIVNAILWDTSRKDHIIYKSDLKKMKRNALIIDVSCDRAGGIESSIPTTIENPIYIVDGITHYVVDHTPTLFWKTTSESLSENFVQFIDLLIEGKENEVLKNAKIFEKGEILDKRIIQFQNRGSIPRTV